MQVNKQTRLTLKIGLLSIQSVPDICPLCLGSGVIIGMGGGPPFVPLWMSNRSGYSVKCGKCAGKGWLPDRTEATSSAELESQIVQKILKEHSSGLNIDEIANLTKLDIPTVYHVLQALRENGVVRIKSGSPVVYYISPSKG